MADTSRTFSPMSGWRLPVAWPVCIIIGRCPAVSAVIRVASVPREGRGFQSYERADRDPVGTTPRRRPMFGTP